MVGLPRHQEIVLNLAYIDPGTGSMVIQLLLASLLSIPFLFRRAVTRTVRRLQGKPDVEPGAPAGHDHAGQDANPGGKGDA
jgi:hypothetical protein